MNHCVPYYQLDDVYTVTPSSTLTRKSSMAADEVMELLWLNGSRRGGSSSHAAPAPPPTASEMQSAVEEAAAEAGHDHLFMQEDEMTPWLHYPIQETNFEPDITEYFNHPPPAKTAPPELNRISTSPLPQIAATRPPIPPPSLPLPPRRKLNFVHFAKLPAEVVSKESRPSLSLAGKESTVVDSNETPKVSQVGSNEIPMVECGNNEGGGTSTLARDSTETVHSDEFSSSSGDSGGSMTACVETPPPALVIGMNPEEDTEGVKGEDRKRKRRGGDDNEDHSLNDEFESGKEKKQGQASTSTKRSRAAEVHNLSERKRRDRINEKMKNLQEIVPCCNKTDKASMLDDAIEYMKTLQSQVQMMSMGYGMVPPMTYPGVQQYMPAVGMGMGMSVSQPLVPYPPMLPGSTMPIPAAGVPMHMPVVHDQSGVQASNPVNPAMISVPQHNPHPNFTNPYLQYLGPQHCQVLIPQLNQAAMGQNSAKPSTSKEDVKC